MMFAVKSDQRAEETSVPGLIRTAIAGFVPSARNQCQPGR